jgi:hypothetical protein
MFGRRRREPEGEQLARMIAARVDEIVGDYAHELGEVREQLGTERARREMAEHQRDELRQELELAPARGWPGSWWVLDLLILAVMVGLVALLLTAVISRL